ncbi:efflux RND transporter periplasmic adaptor subunit [Viridibacterium curvum]|uniref:Uncharacterized protein n=1 Tax=Viridibacterium curvum TaxID=1101404 RepID=A0ABP9QED1_9RHOO
MAESLFSPYWYRAAQLHPRLVSTAQVRRQVFRGEQWYVVTSSTGARQFRVNSLGYQVVGRLDGRQSVQQIWDGLVRQMGTEAPSQTEVLAILSELSSAGMIQSEYSPDLGGIFDVADRRRRASNPLNPMALRVALFDPTPLLDALMPLIKSLFHRYMLWLWALAMLIGITLASVNAADLSNFASVNGLSPRNLLLVWLLYPVIKFIHELAHALAIRHWQGEVHEVGATLFLLTPVPYVDASAASAFPDKYQRMLVSAMGVIAETSIAFLALCVWLLVADGWVRDIAFACMAIGGLSTVLVNANPLMRYDGYYVLTDWLEVPGLAARSDAWLRYLGERWILGNTGLGRPPGTDTQRGLLVSYGIAAFIWRIVLYAGMLFWLLSKQLLLGCAMAAWLLWRYLIRPLVGLTQLVLSNPRIEAHRPRALLGFAAMLVALIGVIGVLPLPSRTHAEGVVWVPDDAVVRADTEGFVDEVMVREGDTVKTGQALLRLSNRELEAERIQMETRRNSLQIAFSGALINEPGTAVALREELGKLDERLQELDERIERLVVRSPADGRLAILRPEDLPGRFLARGAQVAHVVSPDRVVIRTALEQTEIEQLRQDVRGVEVRMAEARDKELTARLVKHTPAASFQLPSIVLGDRGGGRMVTDPADQEGLRTLESFFLVDVEVPGEHLQRIGSRAWVRFDHPPETIAMQFSRRFRQLFVKQLGAHPGDMPASLPGSLP